MSLRRLSVVVAFASAVLFSLLHLVPFFKMGDDRIYDLFLRLKPRRQHIDNVVFLNVDDAAIATIGVFPWPRSVIAEGLLRLKEYGTQTAIFDIEYIDKSPTKVDEIYLRDGLKNDYNRHFSEISSTVAHVLNAFASGNVAADRIESYIDDMAKLIADERDTLYAETLRLASDDDLLLAQAAALFGNTWGTLNLQEDPLFGEQAQRRPFAEERFSYPVVNSGGTTEGINADILPPVHVFAEAVKGAGYTNISPDPDGVRRRIFLAQEVQGFWYLQLAFAPLMYSWDNPAVSIFPRQLVIEGEDIRTVIPLDKDGSMLLDWPHEDYYGSYEHISFNNFSLLDTYLTNIESYLQLLEFSNSSLFPVITRNAAALQDYFRLKREAKNRALKECSDEAFEEYLALRNEGLEQIQEFTSSLISTNYIENQSDRAIDLFAHNDEELSAEILEEAQYCRSLLEYIDTELNAFHSLNQRTHALLNNKICIIGRTDTGTTDIAVNPFHPKYINVGTHAVVLDTILSGSFITPLPAIYSVLFTLLLVPLVLIVICSFRPGPRFILGISGVALSFFIPLGLFIFTSIYLAPLSAVLAMVAAVLIREIIAFVTSEREKRFIRQAFSTYLSSSVVSELIADPSKLNLGGEKREMSAIFTDLRAFSTISEKMDPAHLVRMLNKYLTVMSNIIMDNQGTIDKYIGDAIIAFFGAPVFREDHAALACRSALAIKEAEKKLNAQLLEEGLITVPLFTSLGINTGEMVVGNMGSETKMDYTVMGNSVNLTSRLEGVNKQYQTSIIISEYTKKQAGDAFLSRYVDRVRVVGINQPVLIYELTDIAANADQAALNFHQEWKNAMDCFDQKRYKEAADLFSNMIIERPSDNVAALYARRSLSFHKNPPPPDWDGVISLSEK